MADDKRASLSLADYSDINLKATTDRSCCVYGSKIQVPIDSTNINVFTTSKTDEKRQLLDVVNAVTTAIENNKYAVNVDFEPQGCEWRAIIAGQKAAQSVDESTSYWIHCFVAENPSHNTSYIVEIYLMGPTKAPGGGREELMSKKVFPILCYSIQKEISRLEFPVFADSSNGKSFKSVYQLNEELNVGSFAIVFRGRHRASGQTVAVKSVNRMKLSPADDAAIFTEVALMSNMDHPHIVKVIDFFEESEWYLIVLEYLAGGDLFDRIGAKSSYSEADARELSRAFLSSVEYCHTNYIAHLDLKSKNLLLSTDDDDTSVKLADFGFAQRVTSPNCLTRRCGTPFFVAPEIIRKEPYDERADMWSVGVIVYLLLSGHLPFTGKNAHELFANVLKGQLDFPHEDWGNVSQEAKFLVKKLLDKSPETRWTAQRCLASSWFTKEGRAFRGNDLSTSARRLKTFNARMKLRAAVHVIGIATTRGSLTFKMDTNNTDSVIEEKEEAS